jgi:hypothetical protein
LHCPHLPPSEDEVAAAALLLQQLRNQALPLRPPPVLEVRGDSRKSVLLPL